MKTHYPQAADQHVFEDMEFRKQLAKSIGLDNVPDLDPDAFDRIRGILSERMGGGGFDVVDAVREVRNWQGGRILR